MLRNVLKNYSTVVLLGVLLTVSSTVISQYFIAKNNHDLEDCQNEIMNIDKTIDHLWYETRVFENNINFAVVMLSNGQNNVGDVKLLLENCCSVKIEDNVTTKELVEKSKMNKIQNVDKINDLYISQSELLEKIGEIKDRNLLYNNLALVAYVIGLILVLNRDLSNKYYQR